MVKEFFDQLLNSNLERNSVDPSHFNDEVALKTSWIPVIHSNGSSFCTHEMVKVSPDRIRYRISKSIMIVFLILFFIGIGALSLSVLCYFSNEASETTLDSIMFFIVTLGLGIMSLFGSLAGFHTYLKPIVFDKKLGYFWKGKTSPENVINPDSIKNHIPLEDIYAIQLIAKLLTCKSGKESYSYELNLVTENAGRTNVLDHAKLKEIRRDARELSDFLGLPLWDAV